MNKHFHTVTGIFSKSIPLNQVVSRMVNSSLSAARHHKMHLVNEVEQGIALGTAMQHAIGIMNEILTTIVANSNNGEIHISTVRYQDIVTLEFQERNNNNGYALAYSIGSMEPVAASMGGHISIKGPQQKVTTISFSFPDTVLEA
jgi:glucose-6-phosphate-specific signal transduction histidine kinase